MKYLTFILLSFFVTALNGQNHNTYKFIEPNISISYDSTSFKIGKRYSNTVYETESYDFALKNNPNNIRILVKADIPSNKNVSMETLETMMSSRIEDVTKTKNSEVIIKDYDKKVRHTNNFLCLGAVAFIKPLNSYMTTVICNHISDNDLTEINFSFPNFNNLDSCYKIVSDFTAGFKFYSKEQVHFEDSSIKKSYSVSVSTSKDTIENLKWRKSTFLGTVKINESLKHKVKEVRLDIDYGQEMFEALPNGEVRISCNDKEKGEHKKKGQIILINSFGKKVKIPFEFVYSLN